MLAVFVRNAEVYISNGTITHKLERICSITLQMAISFYYYSIDSSILQQHLMGEFEYTIFTCGSLSDGKEYTAITTIPATY